MDGGGSFKTPARETFKRWQRQAGMEALMTGSKDQMCTIENPQSGACASPLICGCRLAQVGQAAVPPLLNKETGAPSSGRDLAAALVTAISIASCLARLGPADGGGGEARESVFCIPYHCQVLFYFYLHFFLSL